MFGHQSNPQQDNTDQTSDQPANSDVTMAPEPDSAPAPTFTPPAEPITPASTDQPLGPPATPSEDDPDITPSGTLEDSNPPVITPVDKPESEPTTLTEPSEPSVTSSTSPSNTNELLDIKQDALNQLSPLVGHLEQTAEEKFRTTMMMIQASDNQSLVKDAYEAAKQIDDEKTKAQALLDVINEINYFTQHEKD